MVTDGFCLRRLLDIGKIENFDKDKENLVCEDQSDVKIHGVCSNKRVFAENDAKQAEIIDS